MALDPKLTKFTTASPVLATVSFTELITNFGTLVLFGLATENTGGVGYSLVTTSTFSQPPTTVRLTQGTTTIDFDSATFTTANTAKGTATFSAGQGVTTGQSVKLAVTIIHYDGSDETIIGTEQTSATFVGVSGTTGEMVSLRFPLTEQLFAVGDLIRLRVKLTQVNAAGDSEVGHDPEGQDGTFILAAQGGSTTKMQLHMPFKRD